MSAQEALAALHHIEDNHDYREWQTSAIVAAAQLQHADQERIAKALESICQQLHDLLNEEAGMAARQG